MRVGSLRGLLVHPCLAQLGLFFQAAKQTIPLSAILAQAMDLGKWPEAWKSEDGAFGAPEEISYNLLQHN